MIKRIITTPELLDLVNGESKPCVEVGLKDGLDSHIRFIYIEYYYYNSLIY